MLELSLSPEFVASRVLAKEDELNVNSNVHKNKQPSHNEWQDMDLLYTLIILSSNI